MPNFTIKVKKNMVCIECKSLKDAEKRAKSMGGKIIHAGNDLGDDENHPNVGRKFISGEEE